jgi:hypothetical protein
MSSVVVDIQFLKGVGNAYVLKELAIVRGDKIAHWLFKPPHSEYFIPSWIKTQNSYLKNHHHGLLWEKGYTRFEEIGNILAENISGDDTVYVKGEEKVRFLKSWLIIATDLKELDCPAAKKLPPVATICNFHLGEKKICALQQALKFSNWLETSNDGKLGFCCEVQCFLKAASINSWCLFQHPIGNRSLLNWRNWISQMTTILIFLLLLSSANVNINFASAVITLYLKVCVLKRLWIFLKK